MKKPLTLFLAAIFTLGVIGLAPLVYAHGEGSDDGHDNTSEKKEKKKKELTQAEKEALKKRLEEKKQQLAIKLQEFEQKRLMQKCRPAQTVIAQVIERIGRHSPKRLDIYSKLSNKLDGLVEKLKLANVDTTELEETIETLNKKVALLKSDVEADKAALEDLKNFDCESDTEAFQAALETARAAHQKVVTDAADIKKYVQNTLKPLLVEIRQDLAGNGTDMEGDQ